jgi:hypothetical protein
MNSSQYFNYIRNCWKILPDEDRERMGEIWKAYEQSVAEVYQKYYEVSFNNSVKNLSAYNDVRWLPHTFNSANVVVRPAFYRSTQDLSVGVNLTNKFLIKFSWDGNPGIEVDCRGLNPVSTSIFEIRSAINAGAGFIFCKTVVQDALLEFTSPTAGPMSKITFEVPSDPSKDASEFILGLTTGELPLSVPKFPYAYKPQYPFLVSVPELQTTIRDETENYAVLTDGVDYIIKDTLFCFLNPPLQETLWAKRNLFNEETPWKNFGFLINIYQSNSERYIKIIQGLWFAFWTGPRPENVKKALYLLFGLPTSPFSGTVTAISPLEVSITSAAGEVQTFAVPTALVPIVALDQKVVEFQPLVDGIQVLDKVNNPGFIASEVGRFGIQRFLTEKASRGPGPDTDETKALRMLEEYCFLPQISVDAFISPDINLANVRTFLDAIKPLTRAYLFQVIVGTFQDELKLGDRITAAYSFDVTPNLDSNASTFAEPAVLAAHEVSDNLGLILDSEGICFSDRLEVEVRSFGTLVDMFSV